MIHGVILIIDRMDAAGSADATDLVDQDQDHLRNAAGGRDTDGNRQPPVFGGCCGRPSAAAAVALRGYLGRAGGNCRGASATGRRAHDGRCRASAATGRRAEDGRRRALHGGRWGEVVVGVW
ncbi:MAG TPA: hypothetical protein VLW50_04030 [Streptosporangiaceae bacterium]|nr:hypothetical protein [Streptosporangiaceae bacterium]